MGICQFDQTRVIQTNATQMKKSKSIPPFAEEWDFSEGMGIIPEGVSLTQNIGCVGGSAKKVTPQISKKKNKE